MRAESTLAAENPRTAGAPKTSLPESTLCVCQADMRCERTDRRKKTIAEGACKSPFFMYAVSLDDSSFYVLITQNYVDTTLQRII